AILDDGRAKSILIDDENAEVGHRHAASMGPPAGKAQALPPDGQLCCQKRTAPGVNYQLRGSEMPFSASKRSTSTASPLAIEAFAAIPVRIDQAPSICVEPRL